MIRIRTTPNLLGLQVSGENHDLERLHDAIVHVVGHQSVQNEAGGMSADRLMDIAQEIRQASLGERLAVFAENGMTDRIRQHHQVLAPDRNVHFAVRFLMPEAVFAAMAISDFIERYNLRRKSGAPDRDVLALELFQADVIASLQRLLADDAARRLEDEILGVVPRYDGFCTQYVDLLGKSYMTLDPQARRQQILTLARSLNKPGIDYRQMVSDLEASAKTMDCDIYELESVSDLPEPAEQDW